LTAQPMLLWLTEFGCPTKLLIANGLWLFNRTCNKLWDLGVQPIL